MPRTSSGKIPVRQIRRKGLASGVVYQRCGANEDQEEYIRV